MPDTLQGWMWWGFTAVIVGLVINIGANFLTPLARRGGESWFQRRRLKHEKYRAGIEELVKQLKNDPPVAYLYLGSCAITFAIVIAIAFDIVV